MYINRYSFDHDLTLVNLGDVHRGDWQCNVPLFHKVVEYIRRNPKCRWVSTGDLLNVALTTSISSSYKSHSPETEFAMLCKELTPIKDKCLGIVGSNHHRRFEKAVGMSLDKLICREIGIPFIGISGVINITLGGATYYVALHHGIGSGRMRGGKANNLERLFDVYPGADIYLEGHTHTFDFFINQVPYIDRKRNRIVEYPAYFCTTAHFLDWKDSYGEEKKYKPGIPGASILRLRYATTGNFNRKKVSGDLFF